MRADPSRTDATIDYERTSRCGFPEVVYGEGKTPEQVASILAALSEHEPVCLATRVGREHAAASIDALGEDVLYFERARVIVVDRRDPDARISGASVHEAVESTPGIGHVVVACAGTSDLPVAEEAAVTALAMGSRVTLLTDIGVAGVHRTLERTDILRSARAIIVVAGMEGALPSLVAGLVDVPVVAVPTSVGYGAAFGGVTALLGMLTSCAGGVSVVNIDNGFGAGVVTHRINVPPARFAPGAEVRG